MTTRNLLLDPCWTGKDLGKALPESPHAVSVALPRWQDVIAYEEKDPNCINKLKAIYPRFGLNPLVSEVAQKAIDLTNSSNSSAWPYPNKLTAEKAQEFCKDSEESGTTSITEILGLQCLIADGIPTPFPRSFWQHTGLGASSREAAIALNIETAPSTKEGDAARQLICQRLAEIEEKILNLNLFHEILLI